jgi:hypothetical protein
VKVLLHPKRKDAILIDGAILVTEDTADLVRVEGELVKRPSFWTRRVEVARRYGRVAGVRVPLEMRSTASVLIVGASTFSMTYEYETVNGIAVAPSDATTQRAPPTDSASSANSGAR